MNIYKLYVKTHNETGLKYLGFTKSNPHKYKGSGIYWKRHLSVHGNNVTTNIIYESDSKDDIRLMGMYYSDLWNVTNDPLWANLKPETGDGGGSPRSSETKEKIRQFQKHKKQWTDLARKTRLENCLKNAAARKGKPWTDNKRKSTLNSYLKKNADIALKIIPLHESGMNNLQIAKNLGISWDKVKYTILHKTDFLDYLAR